MRHVISAEARAVAITVLLCSLAHPPLLASQESRQEKSDDVLRVKTELVQTDVLVLNKEGQFVEGLRPADFQLRVNGRARTISFLDRVAAGSASEEEKLAAARGRAVSSGGNSPRLSFDRGRSVFFYLDDFHLTTTSVIRAREMLSNFVDREMGPDDEVGIITATGQLGFLEQLTNERAVLHRAIARLGHRSFQSTDAERTPMTESEAAAIVQEDRRILDYFVEQLLKETAQPRPRQPSVPGKTRSQAENVVRARAKSVVDQSAALTVGTLSGLEKLIRLSGSLPWRKVLFFVSDGFFLNDRSNPALDLRRIADAAARAATVIYSIDARGLASGIPDASRKVAFDNTGRLASVNSEGITASQEVLQTLAVDSAGKAVLNSNAPAGDLKNALSETSDYYLMAWRPDEKDLSERGFQGIEVSIAGRPDVMVRVRPGFFFEPPATRPQVSKKIADKNQEKPLPAALHDLLPRIDLPVSLSSGYTDVGQATMLVTSTVEVPIDTLQLGSTPTNETAQLDLLGAVVDEHGKHIASFDQNLTVKPQELKQANAQAVIYNHQFSLPAGLYQIRVALQESKTGRIGTAMQWIEIPDLKNRVFSMSSLFLGSVDGGALQSGKLSINAAHRFRLASKLGFFVYINNAARNASGSDLALQIQVFRDAQPVITKPLVKIEPLDATSTTPIPYGEDVSLQDLPIGKYVLQITVIDRVAKASAQQRSKFLIY